MPSKWQFRMKMTLYASVLLAALLLDEAVFSALALWFRPCVMPVAVACIGLWEGTEKGSIFGLAGGCLWAWSGPLSILGAWHIVALTLVGFGCGLLAQRFLLQSWKTIFSVSVPAVILTEGRYVLARISSGTLPGMVLITDFVPECLLSAAFCLIFYPVTQHISRIGGFHG